MVRDLEKEHKKTSLMTWKKEELVKNTMRLEHNVNALNETLHQQAINFEVLLREERKKIIDEFTRSLTDKIVSKYCRADLTSQYVGMQTCDWIKEIAEQMKGGAK